MARVEEGNRSWAGRLRRCSRPSRGNGEAMRGTFSPINIDPLSAPSHRLCYPICVSLNELPHHDLLNLLALSKGFFAQSNPLLFALGLDKDDFELAAVEVVADDQLVAVVDERTSSFRKKELRVRFELFEPGGE